MLADSDVASKTLPLWAQLTSFAVAVIGFLGTAYAGLSAYFRTAELDAKLTKDSFYRFIEKGEAFFCRATVIANNGPILIRNVSFLLEKLDGAKKSFPLDVEQFGTLISKPEVLFQEHNYFGRSILHYLPADKPERLVYYCHHATTSYRHLQKSRVEDFEADILRSKAEKSLTLNSPEELSQDQIEQIQALIARHKSAIIGSLEIEPGKYRLSATFEYEGTHSRFRKLRGYKSVSTSIVFTLPEDFKTTIEKASQITMAKRAAFLLYGINETLLWPTFAPSFEE